MPVDTAPAGNASAGLEGCSQALLWESGRSCLYVLNWTGYLRCCVREERRRSLNGSTPVHEWPRLARSLLSVVLAQLTKGSKQY